MGKDDDDVRGLVEKGKIADVITTLFVATDAREWERVRGCLAAQVTFDMSSLTAARRA